MACAPSHLVPDRHPGGRPREYDRIQIANDLIEWAKKEDSINFCKFCTTNNPMIPPPYLSVWANEDEQFSKAYELAKAFLGARREELLNSENIHVKAYDLNARTYDFFMEDKEIQKEKRMAAYTQQANAKTPQSIVIQVSNDGLASGINISASPLSNPNNKSSE